MENIKTILLVGSSVDGKVTVSKGVSSKEFGKMLTPGMSLPINQLRKWADAIIVSASTVKNDNPSLLSPTNPNLLRVVLDRKLKLSSSKKVFSSSGKCLLVTTQSENNQKLLQFKNKGINILCLKEINFLSDLKKELVKMGYKKILVEGGGTFNSILIKEKWIDELVIAYFPFLMGGRLTPTVYDGEKHLSIDEAIPLKLISHEIIEKQLIVARYKLNW